MSEGDITFPKLPGFAAPVYLWLLVPGCVGGVVASLREASDAAHRAMDQHSDTCAAGIFKATPAADWPFVQLVPDGGFTRGVHEWVSANVARADLRCRQGKPAPLPRKGKAATSRSDELLHSISQMTRHFPIKKHLAKGE